MKVRPPRTAVGWFLSLVSLVPSFRKGRQAAVVEGNHSSS